MRVFLVSLLALTSIPLIAQNEVSFGGYVTITSSMDNGNPTDSISIVNGALIDQMRIYDATNIIVGDKLLDCLCNEYNVSSVTSATGMFFTLQVKSVNAQIETVKPCNGGAMYRIGTDSVTTINPSVREPSRNCLIEKGFKSVSGAPGLGGIYSGSGNIWPSAVATVQDSFTIQGTTYPIIKTRTASADIIGDSLHISNSQSGRNALSGAGLRYFHEYGPTWTNSFNFAMGGGLEIYNSESATNSPSILQFKRSRGSEIGGTSNLNNGDELLRIMALGHVTGAGPAWEPNHPGGPVMSVMGDSIGTNLFTSTHFYNRSYASPNNFTNRKMLSLHRSNLVEMGDLDGLGNGVRFKVDDGQKDIWSVVPNGADSSYIRLNDIFLGARVIGSMQFDAPNAGNNISLFPNGQLNLGYVSTDSIRMYSKYAFPNSFPSPTLADTSVMIWRGNGTLGVPVGFLNKSIFGDNLGSHIMEQNLQTRGFWISYDGASEGLYIDDRTPDRVVIGSNFAPTSMLRVYQAGTTPNLNTGIVKSESTDGARNNFVALDVKAAAPGNKSSIGFVTLAPNIAMVSRIVHEAIDTLSNVQTTALEFLTQSQSGWVPAERMRLRGDQLFIGEQDSIGVHARLVVEGKTNDGTTDIFRFQDSDAVQWFAMDTDGTGEMDGFLNGTGTAGQGLHFDGTNTIHTTAGIRPNTSGTQTCGAGTEPWATVYTNQTRFGGFLWINGTGIDPANDKSRGTIAFPGGLDGATQWSLRSGNAATYHNALVNIMIKDTIRLQVDTNETTIQGVSNNGATKILRGLDNLGVEMFNFNTDGLLTLKSHVYLPNAGQVRFDDGVGPYIREYSDGFRFFSGGVGSVLAMHITSGGNVGLGPDPSYILDASGSTNAFALPTGTDAQHPTIQDGLLRHTTTRDGLEYGDNSVWYDVQGKGTDRALGDDTAGSYTAADRGAIVQISDQTNNATIITYTLPASPIDKTMVICECKTGSVIDGDDGCRIVGNGINIQGNANYDFAAANTTVTIRYSSVLGEWKVVQ